MFTRFSKSSLAAAVLLAGVGLAHAEGPYVGASLGSPDYKSSINGVTGNGSGVGGKVYGGYSLTPNFAVEGGFVDLGHIDNSTGKVDLRGVYVSGVGRYELAPKLSALGSLGLAQGRFDTLSGKDSSPALKLGAGLEYELSQQLAVRAEYDHYRFSDAFDAKPNVGEFALGIKVGF